MHNLRALLNELLKKDETWQAAFEKIKETLTSDLCYSLRSQTWYNSSKQCQLLWHRSLHFTQATRRNKESHWACILIITTRKAILAEREGGIGHIFAVTKFHRYLHGRQFTLQTDHKPLLSIFGSKKGLLVYTANRLLRWSTILLNYNFKIEYLSSKNICHADLFRRTPNNSRILSSQR